MPLQRSSSWPRTTYQKLNMDFPITVTIPFNDYAFMCQMASENNTTPELFASGILAQTMDEYRDEARWADNQEQLDLVASSQEKIIEETLDF